MQEITIAVSEAGTAAARTFAYRILFEGNAVAEKTLTPVESQQVREIGSQYFSLLQRKGQRQSMSYLPLLRDALSHLFLEKGEPDWRVNIIPGARLVVASSIPEVLQLPWELLGLYGKEPQGEMGFYVIRRPSAPEGAHPPRPEPSSGPLRLLFLASDSGTREEEEKSILQLAEGLEMELVICESGTGEELKGLAEQFRPHLLHLAVPAKITDRSAAISLPGSPGGAEMVSAEDLANALPGMGIQGIVFSGGKMDTAPGIHLFCQRLSESIPLALAWDAPAAEVRLLYQSLAAGGRLEDALLSLPKKATGLSGSDRSLISFPALYSTHAGDLGPIIDSSLRKAASGFQPCREIAVLPGLAEGRTECFVGRRAEIARLFPALRDGSIHTLVITGPDGAGKSALAVHLARLLAGAGYTILPIYSSPENPITWPRLLEAVASHLNGTGQGLLAKGLTYPRTLKERQSGLVDVMKSSRLLLLWDGLVLDGRGRIQDPDLSQFYLMMIRGMAAGRAIITAAALPAEALTLPARAWQWKIEGLSQSAFVSRLLYSPAIAERYRKGLISFAALAEHHRIASGLPLRLDQTARALSLEDMSPEEDALAALTSRLDRESFMALCRAAVYNIAISPSGLAAACGLSEEQSEDAARKWQELSLANSSGKLWTVPSTIRPSLLSLLRPEEIQSAHKAAAGFLKTLAEAGRSAEIGLSRLDVLLEARGHYMAADDWEAAALLTGRISGYLRRRGYYTEIIRLNRELVDLKTPSLAGPAAWIGQAYLDQENFRKAADWYERALQISPDPASYHGLGLSLLHQEKHDLARDNLIKAVDAFHASGDLSDEAAVLSSLAAIDMKKGEIGPALDKLDRIAEIMKVLDDVQGEAQVLQETARLEMINSNFDAARQRIQRSLELLQGCQDRRGAAYALFNLASLDLEKGDFVAAGEEYAEALPLFREMGDRAGVAAILHSQGLILAHAGEKEKAMNSFKEALAINQELGDKAAESGSFFQLGALAVQQDKMAEGLRLMAMAAVVLRSIKSDEIKSVEPLVERLASQLNYSQEQFMVMVQEVLHSYARDRGWGLVERASGK